MVSVIFCVFREKLIFDSFLCKFLKRLNNYNRKITMRPKTVKNILTTIILTAVMTLLMSNKTPDNLKIWDTKDKLTWKDYIDTTIDHSDRAALTNSGIRVSFNQTEANKITINAYSAMDRDKSWVDVTKKSGYILAHEQYHFNITEYWCRRLKKTCRKRVSLIKT
jgi:hypothetical protein